MRPKSLLLLAFIAWTAVAVEHEDQHRDLRLERQLGDDVPLDPESQERLVRIARQMGAIVTTEPSIHVTQTLARPTIVMDEVDSADWELVAPTKEGETPDRTVQERIQRKPRKINLKSSPLVEWRTGQLLPKDSLSETVTSAEKKSIGRYFETIKNRIGSLKSIDFPKAEFRSIWSHTEPEDLASAQFRAEGREDGDPLRERLWTIPSKKAKPQQQLQAKKPDRKPPRKKRPYQGVSTSKPSRYIATPATQTITSFPSPNETAVEHAFTAASTLLDNDDATETTLTSQNTSEMQTETPLEASVDKYTRVPYKMPSFAGLLTHDEVDKVMSIDEKTKNILQQLTALNLYQELPMEVEADEDDARLSLDDSTTQRNEESIIDDRDEGAVVDCSREVHYSVYGGTDPTARHQLRQELFVGSGSNAAFNGQSSVITNTLKTTPNHTGALGQAALSREDKVVNDDLQQLTLHPEDMELQYIESPETDSDPSVTYVSTRSPKNISSDNNSAILSRNGITSHVTYNRKVTRRPTERMSTTRRPMRPGSSKQTSASTARTTTATAIMITPAPSTADDSLDATLEEVDFDKQSQVTDEPDLTTEPLTTTSINTTMPMATMTVTTMTPRRRPGKTLTKKASQAPAGGKNLTDDHSTTTSTAGTNNRVHQKKNKKKKQQSMDSTTKVPSTNGSFMAISKSQQGSNSKSDSTTVLSPVTYQVPQVILPPPQLSMNPLAALTNLLPLLQMLNRPAPLFYQQLSQMASQTAGVGGIKNSVSRPQQLQQQQEHVTVKPMQYQQVPHYSVPQYGISSPYYLPHVYTQQLANMSAASTTTPTPLIPTPLSRPMSLPQMIEPLAEKPNSANSNIANPGKKTHFQRKPQQKPTLQLGGSNQQLPNIATTIRTMMHLLNANNLMLAGNNANRNSKKHRMPKFVDVNDPSYELDNQRFPSNTKYDSNKYYNNSGKRRGEWGKQQELRHDNSTQDKFLMDPVARALDTFKSRAMTNSQSRFVTSESARTKPMVSSALTHKYNDKVTLYDEDLPSGFPQLSDKVDSHFLKPIMGRRMDINVVDENDDANVLGRTIGAESNYKMLIGLLTGALSRRRDFRSLAKQTQRQFDIEKSRQMANNMVMRSLLYSPLPMYQRLPSRVAWPMVQQPSSSLSAAGPQRPPINLVHNIPSATITIGGRPVLYGKHLVDRPRQPRYYFFDGVPRKGHTISRFNERDLKSVEETFDTTFPSAPIKSTFRSIERPMTAAVSLPLTSQTPAKQTAATVKNDTPLETSSSEGLFPIQKPLNFLGGLSVRQQTLSAPPKHQPNADQRQQNFSMEIPYLNTSLPAGVRIVIPTTTSTTMAPSPVIKFTNRIGDRRTRRSTTNQTGPLDRDPSMIHPIYQVKINPFVYAQGLLATKKGQANVNNKPAVPFFEFVGEVRQGNSSDLNSSTALRRSCTSPEQAFLQVNDWNDLLYSTEFRSGFDESEASISSTTPYRYDQRRPVRAIENSEIDDFSRCFYPNTTFSTMLNCNDDIYSCNRGTRSREGCSCDDDCVMFGDCCWDKVSELQKEFGSLADIEYSRERLKLLTCVRSNRNISYHMISKCDPSWKNYPESELCSGSHPEDALLQIPVTSKKTLNTYRNIVCAHCHDDVLDLVFWEVEFHCRKQLQTFSVHRAIGNCPFGTNPPASLTRKEKQFAARPCNPNVDYETSTDLECEHISANESATIRAPSRHVANRLAVMCDLIYLPTINVGVSKCDSVFYRNRFCALCRRHLTRDLRCPVNAAMPMHLDSGELSDENETKFYLNLRWQNSDVLCDKADHTFDPWKKGCRQIFYGKSLPRCDGSGPGSLANNPMSYFLVRQTWFSYVSIGCLVLTIVSYCFGCVDSKIHPFESGPSPVDNIILCLVSSLLGAQLLFHVSITKNNCHTRFTCVYFGVAFHFCTISCFAWTNVLLHKVWTYLKYAAENSDKRLSTFFAGYCLYAWIFPAVTVGIASFTNLTLDSNDRISPCYGCHGICFISNLPAFWLFLGIPLIYAVSINIVRFAEVFQECRNQTEEAMYHCMARLPFRSVISAILLATLIPLTWALALTAVSLHNERAWLTFLFCYACHGPMCLLLSGAVFRYLRPFRRIRVLLTSVQLCTIDHTACRVGAKTSSANEADSDQSRNPFVKPGKRDKEGRSQQLR